MITNSAYRSPQRVEDPSARQGGKGRVLRIGCSILALCFLVGFETEGALGHLRKLCSLETYWTHDGDGPYGSWTEVYKTSIDYYERALGAGPRIVPENSIAFVISMLECPDLDHHGVKENAPPNDMFYDMASMLKYAVCVECLNMTIGGVTYNTTVIALIPGDAIECMGPNGEPYDRIKVLEELRIGVQLLGSPIEKQEISSTYVSENVDKDVGVKDLIKLRIFNMTEHPVVALLDYTTVVMKPIDTVLDTFINSPATVAYTKDYAPLGSAPSPTNQGVNTGFLLVKPDEQEFNDIVEEYKTTEFAPATGWAGSGVGGFPGELGTSGILAHHLSTKAPSPIVLDKCLYNNDFEFHLDSNGACRDGTTTCGACQQTPKEDVSVARLNDKVCGKPFMCPDKSELTGTLCDDFHKKWFTDRVEYEEKYFKKGGNRAKREGTFKTERTLGFCSAEGPAGYEKIVPDNGPPLPIPEPEIAPTDLGCPSTCAVGQYLKQDCTCTSDACEACPEGTRCQPEGNGVPALCIDCECGFCDYNDEPCCNFNGVNNCKSATSAKECKLQNGYYPGFPGAGNACAGVEISATAVPNGCGCKPNGETPCTYDPTKAAAGDKCFITTADEILDSHPATVDACKSCVEGCDPCVNGKGQGNVDDMQDCLGRTMKKEAACRGSCAGVCMT